MVQLRIGNCDAQKVSIGGRNIGIIDLEHKVAYFPNRDTMILEFIDTKKSNPHNLRAGKSMNKYNDLVNSLTKQGYTIAYYTLNHNPLGC